MITLQEIFDTLATGEFSHIKLGNSALGTVTEADYPKLVNNINLGLLALHTKFPLRRGEFIIHQHANISKYYLREEHAATADEMDENYYIELSEEEEWSDDFIKVNSLWKLDGTEIPLNDNTEKELGGFTPSFDVLEMQPRTPLIIFYLEYRAKHPKIIITEAFDPSKVKLHIPDFIEEALLFFVAARVFRGIASKANEGETTSAYTFHSLYRAACQEIINQGLVTSDDDSNANFINNGWV